MTNIQEILDKIGKSPISKDIYIQKVNAAFKRTKPVYVFDTSGKIIETYPSKKVFQSVYGDVRSTMRRRLFLRGKFFSYENNFNPKESRKTHRKQRVKLFKDGVFIQEFESQGDCAKFLGLSYRSISMALNGTLRKLKKSYTVSK